MPKLNAIVIGGSVAGLVSARILAKHFDQVTVVERDPLPAAPWEVRRHLPQGHHQHLLLLRGWQVLEELFPGFDRALEALGAPRVDYTRDCRLYSAAGLLPRFPSRLELRLCRRPNLDWVLAKALQGLPNVTFLPEHRALGLEGDRGRITGVAVTSAVQPGSRRTLGADLVVDAGGRGSRTPQWLQALGCQAPAQQVVNPFLGYASRLYEPPRGRHFDWKAVEIASRPPHNPRAAGLWAVEQGRWLLTLIGTAGHYPPLDEAGFLAFAQGLADPCVGEALRGAVPLSPIYGHRGTESRWRHYERLQHLPEGLVVLGDALCAFNPTHGQGMTLAALGALALDEHLERGGLPGLGPRVHGALAKTLAPVWMLATSDDYRWPGTAGDPPGWSMRLLHRYQDLATPLGLQHPELVGTFLAVANLVQSPWALLRPRLLAPVLGRWLRGVPS